MPRPAPKTEFLKISLSFFNGISICIIPICSYPIININGITILIGVEALSYPGPAIRYIISGAYIMKYKTIGMANKSNTCVDWFMYLIKSSFFSFDIKELMCGIITLVNAVNNANNIACSVVAVVYILTSFTPHVNHKNVMLKIVYIDVSIT